MKRIEGLDKLTGRERYIDDLDLGVDGRGGQKPLWGMTVRTPPHIARGRIRDVRFDPAIDWAGGGFTIVDHKDIPGSNAVFLLELDQPILAGAYTRHAHEAVVLVAHECRETLRHAVRHIEVVIDEEPALLDYRIPPTPDQVQYGDDNVFKHLHIEKGDVEAALARAAHVVEGVYETGAQEHVYLETNGMAAWVDGGSGGPTVVVKGSMQCPYYVLNALKHGLGRDENQCRVIQAATGGGFGGKEDYPSNLALHAALLTLKAGGRPVKIIYDRSEDMAATTKRHPSRVRHRTGHDKDGRLVAQDIDVLLDGGAYVTLSPVVLSRGVIHAGGPYACDNVRIDGRAVLSNAVPFGAFRGFGAPQTQFATERHMDAVARQLGIDPVELRRINLIRDGDQTSTGQVIDDGTDRVALTERALDLADYTDRRTEHDSFNATHPYLRRGIGLATIYHGAGFTGAGEVYLKSRIDVEAHPDGRVEVLSASTEIGQGTNTVFTKIAADRLGLDHADIIVAQPDTARVPNSGPTVASRTAMVVGHLIERACDDLRAAVGLDAQDRGDIVRKAIRAWHDNNPGQRLVGEAEYVKPPHVQWDDNNYRGHAYGTFAWAAYIAEVEVDLRTCITTVTDFVAVQEIGRVLNETLARGQIQGGVVQGIGWGLMEECKWQAGGMHNNQLTNYIIPTSDDVPPIRVEFWENPYAHGAQGAKGIGELPMDGPAPALASAIEHATGSSPNEIPVTPERLMTLTDQQHATP